MKKVTTKKRKPYPVAESPASLAEEASVPYQEMRTVLGGYQSIPGDISSEIDLVLISRNGVKKSALKSLSHYLGISMEKISNLFHTSHRNLQRKEDEDLLDVYKSGQAIEIAQVISKGLTIFGSIENLQEWLHSSVVALGGKKPLDLLDTSFGIRMIYRVLGRLEYGVYS
jgi:putative toxin-antitoxin system antitoxin component (TIGR02293 family)